VVTPRRPRLLWENKELGTVAVGGDGYEWVERDDPRFTTVPQLARVGTVGKPNLPGVPEGTAIEGDALPALRAMSDGVLSIGGGSGGVRMVYIDPPYNTGHLSENYADELDTSLWLSALRDRLEATKPLLAPSASIWVHLDDSEVHRARCVMDEVFGEAAFVATIIWQKRTTRESRTAFSSNHEYIHVYAPAGPQQWKHSRNLIPREREELRNRDDDPRGPWTDAPFDAPGYRKNQQYPIVNPAGRTLRPPSGRSWYATEPVFKRLLAENRIWFTSSGQGKPRLKLFPEDLPGLVPYSLWGADLVGTNDDAKRHLMKLFPGQPVFSTPKPEELLRHIIHIATDPGDTVLDFYAGSGTTAAVAHKMGRRWVAVERSSDTQTSYLLPRLEAVVSGTDPYGVTAAEGWKGGGAFEAFRVDDAVPRPRAKRKGTAKRLIASTAVQADSGEEQAASA
jgi:adenine-specific DNA-methyltransferase